MIEGSLCQPPVLDEDLSGIDSSLRCAAGLGCISYQGVSRCLKFCDPDGNSTECSQRSEHPLGAFAHCGIILDDRPDIGLCSLPCHLSKPEESTCPEGSQCRLLSGAAVAHCGQVGTQGLNAGCGPACQCAPGLVCVRDSFGQSCRQATDAESACGEDTFLTALPGTQDPTIDPDLAQSSPYLACMPCRVIRGDGLSLCARVSGCRDDGGLLASVTEQTAVPIRSAIELHEGQNGVLVGAQMSDDGDWLWGGDWSTGRARPLGSGRGTFCGGVCSLECDWSPGGARSLHRPCLCLRTNRQPCAP